MHGVLKTALGAFAVLSAVSALPDADADADSITIITYDEAHSHPSSIHTTEEFSVTLMFDEVTTAGNYIWPDGYGSLAWSTNHYIFNETEQHLFARNHATSPPNLLYVQDSSHTGGAEPFFAVRPNSPAQSFDLNGVSILPYTAVLKTPVLFCIKGYPVRGGGGPVVRWYKWTWEAQLQYPWVAKVEGVEGVERVEVFVVPGADTESRERLPFTLDDVRITWRNLVGVQEEGGAHRDL